MNKTTIIGSTLILLLLFQNLVAGISSQARANTDAIAVIPFLLEDEESLTFTLLNDFTIQGMSFFTYSGGGASLSVTNEVISDSSAVARPGQVGDETVLQVEANISSGWGGFGDQGSWDFSNAVSFDYWLRGSNSGDDFIVELQSGGNSSNSIRATVNDNFTGWQLVQVPLASFSAQAGSYDASNTTAWVVVLDGVNTTLYFDDVGFSSN